MLIILICILLSISYNINMFMNLTFQHKSNITKNTIMYETWRLKDE